MNFVRFLSIAVVFTALITTHERVFSQDPLTEPPPVLVHPHLHPVYSATHTETGIIAVGERGVILREIDYSKNQWEQISTPFRRTLTAVVRSESGQLFTVGHDALIAIGSATGDDWRTVHSDTEFDAPLFDIWVDEEGHGFAVGAYGLVLATDDFGETWHRREIDPDEPHFNAIRQSHDGTLFIVGEFGTALRSRDNGETWERLTIDFDSTFYGLRANSDGRLLLFGFDGWIADSLDSGDSWTVLESGTNNSLYDAVFVEDGPLVIVGSTGTILIESILEKGKFHDFTVDTGSTTAVLVVDEFIVLVFGTDGIKERKIPFEG